MEQQTGTAAPDQPEGKPAAKNAEMNALMRGGFGTAITVGDAAEGAAAGSGADMNARIRAAYGNGDNNGAG